MENSQTNIEQSEISDIYEKNQIFINFNDLNERQQNNFKNSLLKEIYSFKRLLSPIELTYFYNIVNSDNKPEKLMTILEEENHSFQQNQIIDSIINMFEKINIDKINSNEKLIYRLKEAIEVVPQDLKMKII